MKDKIFYIVFLSICGIVCFGIASILPPNLSIIQNKEYLEQSGFVLKQLNHIMKSPTILMIIPFILSAILAFIVEPQLYGGMITTQFTAIEIFVNLQIIGMYIIAKEKFLIVGQILFTLSIIFVISLIFNIACSLPRKKDEQTYHLIHRSYDTMMWLFLLEIFIFFILGLHSIYGKIIAKDKLVANKIEQKTLPLTNKSVKSEAKPIEDMIIKPQHIENNASKIITQLPNEGKQRPNKQDDIISQLMNVEPKIIDTNQLSDELKKRLRENKEDDLAVKEFKMNLFYTMYTKDLQKRDKLEQEKMSLVVSRENKKKNGNSLDINELDNKIQDMDLEILVNQGTLTGSRFRMAKLEYTKLKLEQALSSLPQDKIPDAMAKIKDLELAMKREESEHSSLYQIIRSTRNIHLNNKQDQPKMHVSQ